MDADPRLHTDRNIWLATTRPDGRPHLIPIWYVWSDDKFYICTESKSVKVHNLQATPRASVALEDGNKPLIAEGPAALLTRPFPESVATIFKSKYNWDISTDSNYTLIEITPEKWLNWSV